MATASVNQMVLWTDLEGTELNGRWHLVRQVRSEGRTGWFEAKDADGKPVMLIITETLNDEDELMDRLRLAGTVHHPNVVAVRDSLVARLDDIPMVIAAMEPTEENLGDVLRERPLGAEETRQVFDALVAGLAAIHGKGLVHGKMEPGSVLAAGETIKLRSDCIHEAGANFASAAGEDVRGVGRIVVQALTRRIPTGENDPVMQLVPEPMARAARRALSGRATVDEIATLAGIRIVTPPAPAPLPAGAQAVKRQEDAAEKAQKPDISGTGESKIDPAESSAKSETPKLVQTGIVEPVEVAATPTAVTGEDKPVATTVPLRAPEPVSEEPGRLGRSSELLMEDEEPQWNRRKAAPWIVLGAMALVVITAFVLYGMLHRSPARQAPPAAAPVAAAPAVRHEPAPSRPSAAFAGNASGARTVANAGPGWRVVAYTYNHETQAQQKAAALQKRFPNLQAGVFAPKGRAPYLVTLGGVMTRDQAIAMRARALRMGMPRDTYARNYR